MSRQGSNGRDTGEWGKGRFRYRFPNPPSNPILIRIHISTTIPITFSVCISTMMAVRLLPLAVTLWTTVISKPTDYTTGPASWQQNIEQKMFNNGVAFQKLGKARIETIDAIDYVPVTLSFGKVPLCARDRVKATVMNYCRHNFDYGFATSMRALVTVNSFESRLPLTLGLQTVFETMTSSIVNFDRTPADVIHAYEELHSRAKNDSCFDESIQILDRFQFMLDERHFRAAIFSQDFSSYYNEATDVLLTECEEQLDEVKAILKIQMPRYDNEGVLYEVKHRGIFNYRQTRFITASTPPFILGKPDGTWLNIDKCRVLSNPEIRFSGSWSSCKPSIDGCDAVTLRGCTGDVSSVSDDKSFVRIQSIANDLIIATTLQSYTLRTPGQPDQVMNIRPDGIVQFTCPTNATVIIGSQRRDCRKVYGNHGVSTYKEITIKSGLSEEERRLITESDNQVEDESIDNTDDILLANAMIISIFTIPFILATIALAINWCMACKQSRRTQSHSSTMPIYIDSPTVFSTISSLEHTV